MGCGGKFKTKPYLIKNLRIIFFYFPTLSPKIIQNLPYLRWGLMGSKPVEDFVIPNSLFVQKKFSNGKIIKKIIKHNFSIFKMDI